MNQAKARERDKDLVTVLLGIVVLGLLIGQMAVLFFLPYGTLLTRLKIALQIIGFYNIGLGFVSGSTVLHGFAEIDTRMTSPNLLEYLVGNFLFLSILFSIWAVGLKPEQSREASITRGCIGGIVMLIGVPLLLVYALFHVFVIMPMAYVGFVLSSSVVENIIYSGTDFEMKFTTPDGENTRNIKDIANTDPVKAKSFLVGVPALAFSLVVSVISLFGSA